MQFWRRLGFWDGVAHSSDGLAGGVCFFWKRGMHFNIDYVSASVISGWVSLRGNSRAWKFYGIYGPPYKDLKKDFFEVLGNMISHGPSSWLCFGDLNILKSRDEKQGGRNFSQDDGVIYNNLIQQT